MLDNYNKKKTANQVVKKFTDKHLTPNSQRRFSDCGRWMEVFANKEVSKMKVYQANFCKNRFCPTCAYRLAHKDAMKISVMMEYIEAEHKKAFILVTLTAPNVRAADLTAEITRYNKAFKKLVERDDIEKINRGYIRKLEITYDGNPKITKKMYEKRQDYYDRRFLKIGDSNPNYDTYHPHFHCVFAVDTGYFSGGRYIKQEKWLELWRDVMQDDTITQVDVRRVKKSKSGADGRNKAINEVAKYAAKDSDYTISQSVFDVFYGALKGRQVLTFNGLFTEANKKYKNKELESYKTLDSTEYVWLLLYRWGGSEYIEKRRREIDQEEYGLLKKDAEDEMSIG